MVEMKTYKQILLHSGFCCWLAVVDGEARDHISIVVASFAN